MSNDNGKQCHTFNLKYVNNSQIDNKLDDSKIPPPQVKSTQTDTTPIPEVDSPVIRSPQIIALYRKASQLTKTACPVLITGETGSGKEVLAKFIHQQSPRHSLPFVAVNCGAIPESLFESEMFGHMKGAFTGAISNQQGYIASAGSGTLFIDEIGELAPQNQVKILRVVEENEYRVVGCKEVRKCRARILAATNKDLEVMVEAGTFREDLFYRLNALTLELPPLRERPEDIPELLEYLTGKVSREQNIPIKKWDNTAVSSLLKYDWPGNIRDLRNLVISMMIYVDDEVIKIEHIIEHGSRILARSISGVTSTRSDGLKHLYPVEFWDQLNRKFKGKGKDMAQAFNCANSLISYFKRKHIKFKPS
jgi:DNA-binding NtrC family response regulator